MIYIFLALIGQFSDQYFGYLSRDGLPIDPQTLRSPNQTKARAFIRNARSLGLVFDIQTSVSNPKSSIVAVFDEALNKHMSANLLFFETLQPPNLEAPPTLSPASATEPLWHLLAPSSAGRATQKINPLLHIINSHTTLITFGDLEKITFRKKNISIIGGGRQSTVLFLGKIIPVPTCILTWC